MATKKVILNGQTIIDLSDTTATTETVAEGRKFYDAHGNGAYGMANFNETSGVNGKENYQPQGTLNITQNGYYNVYKYENVEVNVAESSGSNTVDGWFVSSVENQGMYFKIHWQSYPLEESQSYNEVSYLINDLNNVKGHDEIGLIFQGVYTKRCIRVSNGSIAGEVQVEDWYDRLGQSTSNGYMESRISTIKIMDASETNEVELQQGKNYMLKPEPEIDNAMTETYRQQLLTLGLSADEIENLYAFTITFVEAHEHEYGEWETTKQPTEGMPGFQERTCAICGEKEYREFN